MYQIEKPKNRILLMTESEEYPEDLPVSSQDFVEIYHAKSMQDALFHMSMFSYQLIVVAHMTDIVRLCKVIQTLKRAKDIPVLALCDGNIEEQAVCVEYGADVALTLEHAQGDIRIFAFALIKRYLKAQGEQAVERNIIQEGPLRINYHFRKVFWENQEVILANREFEFLFLLAAAPGRIYTFGQIYQIVWGDQVHGDIQNILWCTLHRIRRKLRKVSPEAADIIRNYRNTGYFLEVRQTADPLAGQVKDKKEERKL